MNGSNEGREGKVRDGKYMRGVMNGSNEGREGKGRR